MTLSHQSEKPNYKCLTFSPGSPTNPWGPGKPCRRDGEILFLSIHLCNWDIFLSVCSLLVPGFQGCLAGQVLQCLLGFPVSNRQWYHGKYFVTRVYCLLPSLYSQCFPLNLEPHQFLECPVRTERKTVNGRDSSVSLSALTWDFLFLSDKRKCCIACYLEFFKVYLDLLH